MYEVEVKLPVQSVAEVGEKLIEIGFVKEKKVREEDCYFDNAASQIRNNGEALRVRTIADLETGKGDCVITYKGKKMDQISKSRRELETGVSDDRTAKQIFEAIGFHAVQPTVVKTRVEYGMGRMNACADRIENLGDFLELEIVVAGEEEKDSALQEISDMLQKLGYSIKQTIRNSYLALLQGTTDE